MLSSKKFIKRKKNFRQNTLPRVATVAYIIRVNYPDNNFFFIYFLLLLLLLLYMLIVYKTVYTH